MLRIKLEKLSEEVRLIGPAGEKLEQCRYKTKLDLHLETDDDGHCILRNLTFYVSNGINEILIGKETLDAIMGLNPEDRH